MKRKPKEEGGLGKHKARAERTQQKKHKSFRESVKAKVAVDAPSLS